MVLSIAESGASRRSRRSTPHGDRRYLDLMEALARSLDDLGTYFSTYGAATFATDEPVYDDICQMIAADADLLALLGAHDRDAQQPNLILNAVKYLLSAGAHHPLGAVYDGRRDPAVGDLFRDFVLTNSAAIDELLRSRRTQTNEVGRSALLTLGMAHIAKRVNAPLAWVDLGTSAGLNLMIDKFRTTWTTATASRSAGPADSAVQLRCEMLNGVLPEIDEFPEIPWRVGIDRAPLDVSRHQDRRWLEACVWPSRHDRAERLSAAISIAAESPPDVRPVDVADIAPVLAEAPQDAHLVVTSTWVWYYLADGVRSTAVEALAGAGRPVTLLSLEGQGVISSVPVPEMPQLLPEAASVLATSDFSEARDRRDEFLGWAHPHGQWADWGAIV